MPTICTSSNMPMSLERRCASFRQDSSRIHTPRRPLSRTRKARSELRTTPSSLDHGGILSHVTLSRYEAGQCVELLQILGTERDTERIEILIEVAASSGSRNGNDILAA